MYVEGAGVSRSYLVESKQPAAGRRASPGLRCVGRPMPPYSKREKILKEVQGTGMDNF